MAADGLAGLGKMFRTLENLKGSARKAARAGIDAGLASLVRTTKKAIDGTDAHPDVKRIGKQTIGKRIVSERRQITEGKTGFGVGKKGKKTRSKRAGQAKARAADKSKRGVGVSASNIHWFVRGAGMPNQGGKSKGKRKLDTGENRGRMKPTLDGVIDTAISVGAAPALAAAAVKTKQVLAREAAKAKAKG